MEAYSTNSDGLNKANSATLELAIADLLHSEGLSFSLSESIRFRRVLTLARCVSGTFQPPGRNLVGGELLDINYEKCVSRTNERLAKEADTFGLAFIGDGATVKKMPLLNIIASSVTIPVAVLEIVDASGHLSEEEEGRVLHCINVPSALGKA